MKRFKLTFILIGLSVLAAKAQYPNILISTSNEPEEVSIAINPKNTNQIVAGANIDIVSKNYKGKGMFEFGVDVGGTFTKAVAIDMTTRALVATSIVPTTHARVGGVASGAGRQQSRGTRRRRPATCC